MNKITITKGDDWHLHLRQGSPLPEYVRATSAGFKRALVMPNLIPPVDSAEALESYRQDICRADSGFEPLMTFKILPGQTAGDIHKLKEAGALAGKYYPAGVTTNSEDGFSDWQSCRSQLRAMEECGLVLCLHGELPSATVLRQEEAFLPVIEAILEEFPGLKIVFEHVSTKAALEKLSQWPENVAATLTVHHLLFTLDDLMGGGLNAHFYCKPVIKYPEDRDALQQAVLGGYPRLFFGSDSAPHPLSKKLSGRAPAGLFSAPAALSLLAGFFEKNGALDKLEPFVSHFGADFYGLPRNTETVTLEKKNWTVPELIGEARPLMAGEMLEWKIR